MLRRIKRDYRHRMSPAKFLAICRKVRHALTGNPNYPESAWAANPTLREQFFLKVDGFEVAYNMAINGDRLLIRERDKLAQELIVMLDEIASLLEAVSVRNPDALFTTGFAVTGERRSASRSKDSVQLAASLDFNVVNSGEPGKAIATASPMPGAYNQEIHINRKDPSLDEYWAHYGIFHDPAQMQLVKLDPGNTFFRMRYHGPDGPGPWSSVVVTTIT